MEECGMFNALRVDNSPFTEQQIEQLQISLGTLDAAQSAWLSGFIAGRLAGSENLQDPPAGFAGTAAKAEVSAQEQLQVFFASQTGNGEAIARALAEDAQRAGIAVEVQSLASLRPAALKKLKHTAFVISTHGEGDPPDDALDLFDYLQGPRAARLDDLRFRVLALGDRSYSKFCEAGRQLEALLLAQGAKTFDERVECDIDYQAAASSWSEEIVRYGQEHLATRPAQQMAHLSVVPPATRWTRANPFSATVERVQKITGLESDKDVYHVELSLEDSGLDYQPGDALGVWAHNPHELVAEILGALNIAADDEVELEDHRHTIHELLIRKRELTRLSADTVQNYASLVGNTDLQRHFEALGEQQRREFIEQRQFADLLKEYPPSAEARITADALAGLLRPLAPRSYSIASSQAVVDEEVHLTVATLYSNPIGDERRGVASDFLNHRLAPGDEVNVYVEPNRRFRLPENRNTPLILISAGTGIAPYRAFLQQLEAEHVKPETWMIFGNPHLRTDFLYQREWLDWRRSGLLTHIDCAFSRDQADKYYVQHVVREQAERMEQWLAREACIYICGGLAMGHEVELALRDVIADQRGLGLEQAAEQVSRLRREGRLLKDLY
jgi:sulfite reductase (NADPH) flavoprotein alpha-component